MDIKNIYFGNSKKDPVLCQAASSPSSSPNGNGTVDLNAFYKADDPPALNSSTETMTLTNNLPQYPKLTLTLTVVKGNTAYSNSTQAQSLLRVGWKYADPSTHRPAFEVPQDIVHSMAEDKSAKLSDYVTYVAPAANSTGPFLLNVTNPVNGTLLYTLTGDMQLLDYVNIINGVAHTYPDQPNNT